SRLVLWSSGLLEPSWTAWIVRLMTTGHWLGQRADDSSLADDISLAGLARGGDSDVPPFSAPVREGDCHHRGIGSEDEATARLKRAAGRAGPHRYIAAARRDGRVNGQNRIGAGHESW